MRPPSPGQYNLAAGMSSGTLMEQGATRPIKCPAAAFDHVRLPRLGQRSVGADRRSGFPKGVIADSGASVLGRKASSGDQTVRMELDAVAANRFVVTGQSG